MANGARPRQTRAQLNPSVSVDASTRQQTTQTDPLAWRHVEVISEGRSRVRATGVLTAGSHSLEGGGRVKEQCTQPSMPGVGAPGCKEQNVTPQLKYY